ncbi:MAG: STAS-like domain-containing protein [Acidiferrobacterales bacterium]
MTDTVIKLPGTDLASRQAAARVRYNVANAVSAGNTVVVDLSEIESVSYAYADELFGVIAATQGFDWLVEQIKIVNTKEHVLRVIAEVINRRLKETGQPIRHRA